MVANKQLGKYLLVAIQGLTDDVEISNLRSSFFYQSLSKDVPYLEQDLELEIPILGVCAKLVVIVSRDGPRLVSLCS